MAPAFAVGDPESILGLECGTDFRSELLRLAACDLPRDSQPAFYTADLPGTSWHDLLDRVEVEVGDGRSPNLWALREFHGAYLAELPAGGSPLKITLSNKRGVYRCLGRTGLRQELIRFARVLELPTQEDAVKEYFMRDVYNDDEGYDICAYCQIMLALIESERRGQPVWLI